MVKQKPKRKKTTTKKKNGRPFHVYDEAIAGKVLSLAQRGLPQDVIAILVELSKTTLHKYYKKELEKGKATQKTVWAEKLMDGIKKGNTALIIFFGKTQMGWTEKQAIEHSGKIQGGGTWHVATPLVPPKKPDEGNE